MTEIEEFARWVSAFRYEDIPERVLDKTRRQLVSVMGSIYAGAGSGVGKKVASTVREKEGAGPCALFPEMRRGSLPAALLQNLTLSMALDYDDYLFMGHTGHSSILVPIAVAEVVGGDTKDILVAAVAANEVGGRLGASVLLGPHNGQMWSHIHLLGSAAAASRILHLGEDETADAMALSLSQPGYPLFPAFMGSESKVFTAAFPAITGTTCAFLAQKGVKGNRAIIEDSKGFWANFSILPLRGMMSGLGESWVTDTIAYKPYPGCAYVSAAVDALLDVMDEFRRTKGREIEAEEINSIRVGASFLAVAMEDVSKKYRDFSHFSPVQVNFSIALSLALCLLAGDLSGEQFEEGYLEGVKQKLLAFSSKIEVEHEPAYTVELLRSIDKVIELDDMLGSLSAGELKRLVTRAKTLLPEGETLGFRKAVGWYKALKPTDKDFIREHFSLHRIIRLALRSSDVFDLTNYKLDQLTLPFGARVSVELKDSRILSAERIYQSGSPGSSDWLDVPLEKFAKEALRSSKRPEIEKAVASVLEMEKRSIEDMERALFGEGKGAGRAR
ncbi:MAG: MmgE/PrpD family protein [Actinomycetota bacterium]|nr:MmgE/PrpD family protein [Actinomycetota bacterium]